MGLLTSCCDSVISIFTGDRISFWPEVSAGALREAAMGRRVLLAQFMAGGGRQGADHPVELLAGHLLWMRLGLARRPGGSDDREAAEAVVSLWRRVEEMAGDFDLIVLDELVAAVQAGWLGRLDACDLLSSLGAREVVLTGENVDERLRAHASRWTESRAQDIFGSCVSQDAA